MTEQTAERMLLGATTAEARLVDDLDKLSDPNAVHANMLRGTIANQPFNTRVRFRYVLTRGTRPSTPTWPDQPRQPLTTAVRLSHTEGD